MLNTQPNNLLNAISTVILNRYGQCATDNFIKRINDYFHDQEEGLCQLPYIEQINHLNTFWDTQLLTIPATTAIREWLVPTDNIIGYVNDFDEVWLELIYATGLLTGDGND